MKTIATASLLVLAISLGHTPGRGKRLKYSYWLQPQSAPTVYILPGLGAHRLANPAIALAEIAYGQVYSAVVVGSVFNCEFTGSASTYGVVGQDDDDVGAIAGREQDVSQRSRNLHCKETTGIENG